MRSQISKSWTFLTAWFGHCGACMRQSLTGALIAWTIFGIGVLMWPQAQLQTLIGLIALGLSALWMLHVAVYTAKARDELRVDLAGRRRALGLLLRAAGAGVAASVPVLLWSTKSFAFCGQCTKNADCGYGYVCKNTAAVNSGKICNECVKS